MISRGTIRSGWIGVLAVLAIAVSARAGSDYSDKAFGVRLAPAFIRFTEVESQGGQTAANRYAPAINPAASAWTKAPGEIGVALAPYYSTLLFEEGLRLHVIGEAARVDLGAYGVLMPVVSHIRSNKETIAGGGREFDYRTDTAQLTWAKRFENFAFGATFSYTRANVVFTLPGVGLRLSDSDSDSYRFRVGGLWEPAEKWLIGLAVEYGFAPFDAWQLVSVAPPAGLYSDGTAHQWVVRPGVSYEYVENSTVYADYQFGAFDDNIGSLRSHRFSAGVEHCLWKFLFLRAGASVDHRGNVGGTCGVSVHFAEWGSVEAGYQVHMQPELEPEFGKSQTLMFTLSLRF